MELRGAAALVTGASRGVGRAIALALAEAGADVACAARATDVSPLKLPGTIDATAREVEARGRRGLAVPTDLSKPAEVEAMVEGTIAHGVAVNCFRIDVPIAAEGFVYNAPELDKSDWEPTEVGGEGALWMLAQPPEFTGQVLGITDLRRRHGVAQSRVQRSPCGGHPLPALRAARPPP